MRHDPAVGALVIMLRGLKMRGMAQAVDELAQQGAPAFQTAIPMLSQLLKAETAEREVRSMAYQIKIARFPAYRDLAGFDFSSSEVNEALVRQLRAEGGFQGPLLDWSRNVSAVPGVSRAAPGTFEEAAIDRDARSTSFMQSGL